MTNIIEGGDLGLQALVVCQDGGVTLHHGMKLIEEEDGAGLLVDAKDFLNRHPEVASVQIRLIHGEIKDRVIDGAEDLAADTALHGIPLGDSGLRRSRAVDVLA